MKSIFHFILLLSLTVSCTNESLVIEKPSENITISENNTQSEEKQKEVITLSDSNKPVALKREIVISRNYYSSDNCGLEKDDKTGTYNLTNQNHSEYNTEEYDRIYENGYLEAIKEPMSTFSIDVDAASYSNTRRFITQGAKPPKDAIRIEEFVNYFSYDYESPKNGQPFQMNTELSECPWNTEHQLLHIGIQGKEIEKGEHLPSNLVFLIDVSGSMSSPNKLPLLKKSFQLLLNQLDKNDRIAIVVYAGAAGLALPSTTCNNSDQIMNAINNLTAGGSTAGGEGINLAYKIATENYLSKGNNRIILATDGDFNIGVSSNGSLTRLIEEKRESGVFLSVIGFGSGNYKDSKMEQIADKGNGNYYYIDNLFEAKKVLVTELGGTLYTIAKDVKIQVEFNPAKVQNYRLIGYENRALNNEDFANDKKDAGELGAGHSVTALYEIIPTIGVSLETMNVAYKYQQTSIKDSAFDSNEIATLRLRYKKPNETTSNLIEENIYDNNIDFNNSSNNFKFSAAVAAYGLILRDSEYKGKATFSQVLSLANSSMGIDKEGYRHEFVRLVGLAEALEVR